MLPLKDLLATRRFPIVTIALILASVAVYFVLQPAGQLDILDRTASDEGQELAWTVRNAAIPCELTTGRPLTVVEVAETFVEGDTEACGSGEDTPPFSPSKQVYLAVLTSMFLHGGVIHLATNMLFLWVFGDNLEDRLRPLGFLLFYLAGGVAATVAHVALQPQSTVPVIGASGAIAAVMGGYLALFPNARILTLVLLGIPVPLVIRAKWVLGVWFVSQFLISPNAGIAWAAHVGGFVFGFAVLYPIRERLRPPVHTLRGPAPF